MWARNTCTRCRVIRRRIFGSYYYLHYRGNVYRLPKEYTIQRLIFWREVRNSEARSNSELDLAGLRDMADLSKTIEELGFVPAFRVANIDVADEDVV